jgi:hypothetical protein
MAIFLQGNYEDKHMVIVSWTIRLEKKEFKTYLLQLVNENFDR